MLARPYVLTTFALIAAATAATVTPAAQCSTGTLQCCGSTLQANSVQAVSLIELLGIITSGLTGLIGLNCGFTPLPGGVVTTDSCAAATTPLCCQEPDIGDGISAGCELLSLL